jgi:hypothetical protein
MSAALEPSAQTSPAYDTIFGVTPAATSAPMSRE